MSYLFKVVNFP